MKKLFITLVAVVIATSAAMAQKTITWGPKIGVDLTHYWGKDALGHKPQLNYQAGVYLEFRFINKMSFAPELVFAAQGGKWSDFDLDDQDNKIPYDATDHVNYINLPLMLKYYVHPSFSIDFGPQLGYNVYSKTTYEYEDKTIGKYTMDYKEETKELDFAIALGCTYNIASDVFVQARYTLGLSKVFNDLKDKNGNAQIAIGYRF
jgi:hypothetical protein